jgi:transcriptional regulator with GAF, ATPase, and Fis domain
MEPIPPTREAIEKLERLGDTDVERVLRRLGERVLAEVPTCVGLSLTLVDDNVTLTLVASDSVTTQLDAMQYLGGGPCVEAASSDRLVEINEADLLDEERWSLFARVSAANGVQSSLSMPLVDQGRVVGGVNLYASTRDAFHGHHDELARFVGAHAPDAVRDADLPFSSRLRAAAAPGVLAAQADIDTAVGFIAASQGVDTETALERLRDAAARSASTDVEVARTVIRLHLT